MKFAIQFVLAVCLGMGTAAIAQAHGSGKIHDAMEEIGDAFKAISSDLARGTISARSRAAAKTLVAQFELIQKEVPTEVPNGKGGKRAITPAEAAEFGKANAAMLDLAKTLQTQIEAGDVAAAKDTRTKMVDLRNDSHEKFKPED